MILEQRKHLTLLLYLVVLLAVACTQTANGTAKPTLVSVLLRPTATSTPVDHVEPEPSVTATTDTSSSVADGTLPTAESVAQQPPTPWPETGLPIVGQLGPSPIDACVVYQNGRVRDEDLPYVYAEPSTASAVIGQLGNSRWAIGLQVQNGWYEIVLGTEITGWMQDSGVGTHGPCGVVSSPEPQWPVLGSIDPPPTSGCVVYQSGQVPDESLPHVYANPNLASTILGQLGRNRWANGLQIENGWIEIIVGPGETGWVLQTAVSNNGHCAGSNTPLPEVPLIMNRGAPANDRCVVINPQANVNVVNVYAAPDLQTALVAQLGNWADVLQISEAWYEILIPQGGTGWVQAERVTPAGGCAPGAATPVRIQFAPGATSATLTGELIGEQQAQYLLWAAAGQTITVSVTNPDNSVLFHIEGVADGQVYKHLLDGEISWQSVLAVLQDYLLTLDNVGESAPYTLYVSIE